MKIIVGKLAGFCGGVINSVTKTEEILNKCGQIYCLGELVHNKQVVDKLVANGLIVVNSLDDVENGAKVIVRAHGVAKEVYELAFAKNIELFDLTCPKVLKIHDEAKKLVNEDYFIILIAQEIHPEAIGTISFCGENSTILENEEQINNVVDLIVKSQKKKVAVISQTTFSVKKFKFLVDELSKKLKAYNLLVNNTICSATDLRQKETLKIASEVEAMIIIGGKNSSNTKKLYEIASSKCSNSFIIETLEDLNYDVSQFSSLGVMAGASTPKESIQEVVNYLERL